ncbi:hypothetical protein EMIT0P265_70363 [Pseudomonas zeae]
MFFQKLTQECRLCILLTLNQAQFSLVAQSLKLNHIGINCSLKLLVRKAGPLTVIHCTWVPSNNQYSHLFVH